MEPPGVPLSQRHRLIRDYTRDEDVPNAYRPANLRQNSSGSRSPGTGSPDEHQYLNRPFYIRSPSRQDTESVITQIRGSDNGREKEPRDEFNIPERAGANFSGASSIVDRDGLRNFEFNLEAIEEKSFYAHSVVSTSQQTGVSGSSNSKMPDFFGHEVFQTVLHNPTTAHQLLLFSQSRLCGENMEFLEKVDYYHTLLDQVTKTMFEIHRDYISTTALSQINIPENILLKINKDLKYALTSMLPKMEAVFNDSSNEIERLVASDIYPRFVRQQMTLSVCKALATDRTRYAGLGDCFVLTNPSKADNPIVYASDGFVKVTGYSRQEIIPRNCRFLQGRYTHHKAVSAIKAAVDKRRESVELLLNYKKTGEPFWNLLYVTPLYDSTGTLAFFLGGQINCSTTIHNASDILRILAFADDVDEDANVATATTNGSGSGGGGKSKSTGLFKAFRSNKPTITPRPPGMENGLLNRIEKMNMEDQIDAFYTAYSKFIIVNANTHFISFHSAGIVSLLYPAKFHQPTGLNHNVESASYGRPTPGSPYHQPLSTSDAGLVGQDVFRFLSQHTLNSLSREYKSRVKNAMKAGAAVSLDLTLCTRRHMGFEKFVTHWTPLKDETGRSEFVVLTLGSLAG